MKRNNHLLLLFGVMFISINVASHAATAQVRQSQPIQNQTDTGGSYYEQLQREQEQQEATSAQEMRDGYPTCVQAAEYLPESERGDHVRGCQCLLDAKEAVFNGTHFSGCR